jgi:hypothetical protein
VKMRNKKTVSPVQAIHPWLCVFTWYKKCMKDTVMYLISLLFAFFLYIHPLFVNMVEKSLSLKSILWLHWLLNMVTMQVFAHQIIK